MISGFFEPTKLLAKAPISRIPKCGACGLFKTCKSPKMKPSGKGGKGILIIAEAPGKDEDAQGIQLVGNSGKELVARLAKFGINMRRDCWLTNSLICRPPNNRKPTNQEIDYCRANLLNTIEELQPQVIIPLGDSAVQSLIPILWKDDVGSIRNWVGWNIPSQKFNAWICPNYHPAHLLWSKSPLLDLYFNRWLEKAVSHKSRPWEKVPNYTTQVKLVYESANAAHYIRTYLADAKAVAFDYETNMLKPDDPEAEIISCSVSDGETAIAFPWHGAATVAMAELMRNRIPKIASNMKFEDRWTRAKLGVPVNNWYWDTMVNAHILDIRPGISGLKFQSFVRLGAPEYAEQLDPFLQSEKGKRTNRIREVELSKLLLYNGLDSLLEVLVAQNQMKEFGL